MKLTNCRKMESDLCSVKWKGRTDHLQSMYLEFFQKELFCDVTLVTGKDRFKSHCFVLCSFSSYFKDILTSVSPGQYPVIFLNGTAQEVKWLLEYLYKGEVVIPVASVEHFLSFGEYLGIRGLCESENDSSEDFATPDVIYNNSVHENSNGLSTSDLASPVITSTSVKCSKRKGEKGQTLSTKRPKTDKNSTTHKELNQTPLCNEINLDVTPVHLSPIITSHIIIPPNKKPQENESTKGQLSLTQEGFDLPYNRENIFDESNILNSPPRPCSSEIFDIGDNEFRAAITLNETQQSVIFQENHEVIVEISDDESPSLEVEHSSEKSVIINENQEDASSNQQCDIPVDSQPQMDSDDSEIMNRSSRHEMLAESNSCILNVDKKLKVVLERYLSEDV